MKQTEFDAVMQETYKVLNITNPDDTTTNKIRQSLVNLLEADHSESGEVMELTEADAGGASAKFTLITAGRGSSGYYTEASLRQAAADGLFNEDTRMFLNHQTQAERAARPEGDVTKQVGRLTGRAVYVEGTNGQPGRLVAPGKIYPEFKQFVQSRKDDIGLSVRVGVDKPTATKDGLPLVERMAYALSVDYVTKAGRGGKIEELYESFRGQHPGTNSGNQPQETKVDEKKIQELLEAALKPFQAQITGLQGELAKRDAVIDRLQESQTNINADRLVQEALTGSGLSARGQARVKSVVLANLPMANGVVDVVKLKESVAAEITAEKSYLQESGIRTAPVVQFMGSGLHLMDESGKERKDSEILLEADKMLGDAVGDFLGKEKAS